VDAYTLSTLEKRGCLRWLAWVATCARFGCTRKGAFADSPSTRQCFLSVSVVKRAVRTRSSRLAGVIAPAREALVSRSSGLFVDVETFCMKPHG